MSIVKLNNRGVRSATAFGSISSVGSMILIKKLTASSSATLSFVDGTSDVVLDNTYKEYLFTFNNMHPETNQVYLQFNLSVDSGSNYNVQKQTTFAQAYQTEDNSAQGISYQTSRDLANGTGAQYLTRQIGNGNDDNAGGYLHLYNPSSTTFVKHFTAVSSNNYGGDTYYMNNFVAGYANTTSAVDAVQFSMSSDAIDAGDICLYGIS
jgi:hypothetical protein